jgi:UDP-glucuronate 4-epimerase
MTILVTGAAGFIGYHVSKRLLARGTRVIGIDNLNDYYSVELKEARIADQQRNFGDAFRFIRTDFADAAALAASMSKLDFDRIVHLGAQAGVRYSIENPQAYVQSNLVGHLNLLELARHRGSSHLVYASSSSVYWGQYRIALSRGGPGRPPALALRRHQEGGRADERDLTPSLPLPQTGLRSSRSTDRGAGPTWRCGCSPRRFFEGRPIDVFGEGNMRRDFTYIDDIVSGIVACLDNPPPDDGAEKAGGSRNPHRLYNIGNHRSEELTRMIAIIEEACGRPAEKRLLPMQPGDVRDTYADITAIQRDLGFAPTTSIDRGVPAFVNWYREYHGV